MCVCVCMSLTILVSLFECHNFLTSFGADDLSKNSLVCSKTLYTCVCVCVCVCEIWCT